MAQSWNPQLLSICEFSCGECGDKPCWGLEGGHAPCDGCIATMHRHDASADMMEALEGLCRALIGAYQIPADRLSDDGYIYDEMPSAIAVEYFKARAALVKARGQV